MSSTTISVVLATFNGERFLAEQLESIGRQRLRPDEVVVGDDGSTDGTLDIIEAFGRSSGIPVTVVGHDHSGVGANFLRSVEASRGRYVAFADQDDVWLPEKLERSLDVLRHTEADLVAHGVRSVDADLRPVRTGYPGVRSLSVKERLESNIWFPIGGNVMFFDRDLLDGCDWVNRPASQWSNDQMNHDDLVKLLAAIRGRTVRIPDRLLLYRQHRSNVEGAARTLVQAARGFTDHSSGVIHRADVAASWSGYFTPLVPQDRRRATAEYFRRAETAMRERATRLSEPALRSFRDTAAAVARGEYTRRSAAGSDWRWALQDFYSIVPRGLGGSRSDGPIPDDSAPDGHLDA